MNKLATRFALLALVGSASLISPAFAAPNGGGMMGGGQGAGVDCQANPKDPACMHPRGNRGMNGGNMSNGNMSNGGNMSGGSNRGNMSNSQGNGDSGNGGTNSSNGNMGSNNNRGGSNNNQMGSNDDHRGDRDHGPMGGGDRHGDWRHRWPGYNFGYFAPPSFAITLGTLIPNSYGLRPVPRFIWEEPGYHRYRGYLYFTTRDGDFVIVTPGPRHRIVRVISDF